MRRPVGLGQVQHAEAQEDQSEEDSSEEEDLVTHGAPLGSGVGSTRLVVDVPIDVQVDVDPDRVDLLLGEVAEQAGAAGEQGEPAHRGDRQVEVGEHRAADPGTVERERPAEHRRVGAADRLEQGEVVAERPVVAGQREQHGCARVAVLVDGVAEAGDEPARPLRLRHHLHRQLVPLGGRRRPRGAGGEGVRQEDRGVLGDAEEARAAAEQSGGERALQRVRRAGVGQAGGDRRRGQPVVGEGDEHGLEHRQLLAGRPPLGDEPVRQLAEAQPADQLGGEVVAEQRDRLGCRGPDPGAVRRAVGRAHGAVPSGAARSHSSISSPCSPSRGGGYS